MLGKSKLCQNVNSMFGTLHVGLNSHQFKSMYAMKKKEAWVWAQLFLGLLFNFSIKAILRHEKALNDTDFEHKCHKA